MAKATLPTRMGNERMLKEETVFDFLKPGRDKNIAQQLRLFKEFWWLWAIKTHWRLGFDRIMVSDTADGMFDVLLKSNEYTTELWIVGQFIDGIGVEKVQYKPDLLVGSMLFRSLAPNLKPLYVVASTPRTDGSRLYVIYRPKEGPDALIEDLFDFIQRRSHVVHQ